MLDTFFRPPSMLLDLSILLDPFSQVQVSGTLPGTLLFPLSFILFRISHDFYWKPSQAQAYLFYVYGSLFFGHIRAFLLGFSYAL